MTKFVGLAAFCLALPAFAYESGSSGADGAFTPAADVQIDVPADGILHYTTINIASGVTVTFRRNASNTPVFLLATGDVTIEGVLDVSGTSGTQDATGDFLALGGLGGPGGSGGGSAAAQGGLFGLGPGAGAGGQGCTQGGGASPVGAGHKGAACPCGRPGGQPVASVGWRLMSGGAGGGAANDGGGGGGGGVLVLASNGTITVDGEIRANGGAGAGAAGSGGGGAIRLVADIILGDGTLRATGGPCAGCQSGGCGGDGLIQLETISSPTDLVGGALPPPTLGPPQPATLFGELDRPQIVITAVGGEQPPIANAFLHPHLRPTMDVTGGASQEVTLTALGVSPGTIINVSVTAAGQQTVFTSTPLQGTQALSTATATITVPTTTGPAALEAWIPGVPIPEP